MINRIPLFAYIIRIPCVCSENGGSKRRSLPNSVVTTPSRKVLKNTQKTESLDLSRLSEYEAARVSIKKFKTRAAFTQI